MASVARLVISTTLTQAIVIVLVAFLVYLVSLIYQQTVLPEDYVTDLVRSFNSTGDASLERSIAIVTGSTSGLGKSIASQLYKYGSTVVIASRSSQKCIETIAALEEAHPSSRGSLVTYPLDLSDLDSVSNFTNWFIGRFDHLHFLINNAGINYATLQRKSTPEAPLCSAQGHDLTFASNYLGHFLLTDKLMPLLGAAEPRGRVVQVSSNAQFMVDGEDLRPPAHDSQADQSAPLAARCEVNNARHETNAYGNSKLAQVLHSVALQRRFDASDSYKGVKIVNVSPGLTLTGMVPSRPVMRLLLGAVMFSAEAAALSSLHALLSSTATGGFEYVVNTKGAWVFSRRAIELRQHCARLGVHSLCQMLSMLTLGLQQRLTYGKPLWDNAHAVARDQNSDLAENFYLWSQSQLATYQTASSD